MSVSAKEMALVDAATDLIRRRGTAHSHAAAVLCADGQMYLGVNLYHFSGGPCAEVVALGRMLTDTEWPPIVVVAVGRDGRGVVTPCGVCRQILYDRWPDIALVISRGGDLVRVALTELLPEP
ncbi:cytidine deaminase family protein [Dactylosporangium sp. CA-092794]|uniref:cytidine deaminase family protein n=1 Tax=Dactylosporangium sp. CA-092794 TaxID=3239929 RepID=UPI003D93013B